MSTSIDPKSTNAGKKAALRDDLRRRLAGVPRDQAAAAATRAADRFLEVPEVARARGILVCLSFGVEIDTWTLVDRLLEMGRAVYVPRADRGERRLHIHRYPCELETLSFGLRQPPRTAPEVAADKLREEVDVVLVLGLGFDRRGFRLGHGGGYFDRFLADRALPAIGMGFHLQLLREIPHEPHDIPMTVVVTEEGCYRTPSNALTPESATLSGVDLTKT